MTNPFTYNAASNFYKKALVEITSKQSSLPISPKILICTAIVATIIYKSMKWPFTPTSFLSNIFRTNNTAEPSPPIILAFEDKYFKEYDKWKYTQSEEETTEEHKKECLENMYYSTVRETINDFYGDVIMCYDNKTSSFAYYARTGAIPYKYLETISRKYMIETNAPRDIHVDIRSEYDKAKHAATTAATTPAIPAIPAIPATIPDPEHVAATTETDDHEDTVYVKLKSYNTASNLKIHTHTNDKTTTEQKPSNNNNNNNNKSNVILRENANRYSYRGKITDFEEHNRRTRLATQPTPSISPTGYSEYKKRMMKSAL